MIFNLQKDHILLFLVVLMNLVYSITSSYTIPYKLKL